MKSLEKDAIPQLSINCVIFGFHEKELKVIVNKISIDGIVHHCSSGRLCKTD